MFDSIKVTQGPAYPQDVNIQEHRAPTDASVRLLSEMEAAAEARVLARGTTPPNVPFQFRWVVYREAYDDALRIVARCKVNDVEHEASRVFTRYDLNSLRYAEERQNTLRSLLDSIGNELFQKVVEESLRVDRTLETALSKEVRNQSLS